MRFVLAVSFITMIFSGCVTPAQKKAEANYNAKLERHCESLANIGKAEIANNVRNGRISIGMTKLDVIYAMRLVGNEIAGIYTSKPGTMRFNSQQVNVNKNVTSFGASTQWAMPYGWTIRYLHFEDAILWSWQTGN